MNILIIIPIVIIIIGLIYFKYKLQEKVDVYRHRVLHTVDANELIILKDELIALKKKLYDDQAFNRANLYISIIDAKLSVYLFCADRAYIELKSEIFDDFIIHIKDQLTDEFSYNYNDVILTKSDIINIFDAKNNKTLELVSYMMKNGIKN